MQGRPAVHSKACGDSTHLQSDSLKMYLVDCWADAAEGQHFLRLLDGEVADANMPNQALHSCQNMAYVFALPHGGLSYLICA